MTRASKKKLHSNFVQVGYHPFPDDFEPRSVLSQKTIESNAKLVRRNISEAFMNTNVPAFMQKYVEYSALVAMRSELLKLGGELWNSNDGNYIFNYVLDNYIYKAADWTSLMAPAFFIYAEIDKGIGMELALRAKAVQHATDMLAYMAPVGSA